MKRLLTAAVALVALALAAPATGAVPPVSVFQGEESGDPCSGHQPGDLWEDPSGGLWTCIEDGWTDGWAYYGIRRAEHVG